MKFVLFGLCVLVTLVGCMAGIGLGKYSNPDHPGKCYISSSIILSPGETSAHTEECSEYRCKNAEGEAAIVTCGVEATPSNCKLGEKEAPSAKYPDCCTHKVIC